MHIWKITALVAAPLLAACAEDQATVTSASFSATPGTKLVAPSTAAEIFGATCLATAPDFSDLPQVISNQPFIQNSGTGTYYHKTDNLSVKAHEQGCSLVFKSNADPIPAQLELLLAAEAERAARAPGYDRSIQISAREAPEGGAAYFRIGIPRS